MRSKLNYIGREGKKERNIHIKKCDIDKEKWWCWCAISILFMYIKYARTIILKKKKINKRRMSERETNEEYIQQFSLLHSFYNDLCSLEGHSIVYVLKLLFIFFCREKKRRRVGTHKSIRYMYFCTFLVLSYYSRLILLWLKSHWVKINVQEGFSFMFVNQSFYCIFSLSLCCDYFD